MKATHYSAPMLVPNPARPGELQVTRQRVTRDVPTQPSV